MDKRKKVIAAVIKKNNRFLIAQRGKKDSLYNKWEFPGGKIEEGESEQECLQRELSEELGITAEIGEYLCTSFFEYNNQPMEMLAFYVYSFSGEFTLYEHKQIKWVKKEELTSYDFPDPDKTIIKKILEQS